MNNDFVKNYYKLLTEDYAGINLTRITDFEEFNKKQIIDSIGPYKQSARFKEDLDSTKLLIDIGFGGGFPILPMANELPKYKFIGIETRNKKVTVVGDMAKSLGLSNVELFHSRIESIFIDMPVVCTFKAVGKVNDFLSKINTNQKITVYFYKGPNFYEIEEDQLVKAKKRWDIVEEIELDIPGTEKRYLIGFSNKNVPHGTDNERFKKISEIYRRF